MTRIYIALDVDRWDILAYDFYGDASLVKPLMNANPDIPPNQIYLKAGQRIVVPKLASQSTSIKETTVKAPWK